jgi:hypothetical protein
MKRKDSDIHFRFPKALKEQVHLLAVKEYRSINSMLIVLVQEALKQRGILDK